MVQREPSSTSAKSIRVSRCLHIDHSKQHTCFGNHPSSNGEYNWRSKNYHVSRALPPLPSIKLFPERHYHHSKRLLKRIPEEFDLETAGEMTFVERNDFQQGSTSNNEPQRPHYYGTGLGDVSFVEEDDDYEFLLDEALARDGLYRGSLCNFIFYTYANLKKAATGICCFYTQWYR
jgi:hypothetical protein